MLANGTRREIRERAVADMNSILGMSRAELRAVKDAYLRDQVAYAFERSPFYAARLDRDLVRGFKAPSQLEDLPFTEKEDLRNAYPFGFLATPFERLIRYGESTGSTGPSTSAFMTYADWERNNVWLERSLSFCFDERDFVFIALPYELAFASYDIDRAFEGVGATIVPVGTLNMVCPWSRTLRMMASLHPSTIVCTPTRALAVFDLLAAEGYDPLDVHLKKLYYVGETCSSVRLRKIAELWNGVKLTTAYGTTETNSLALPCAEGKLHLMEDRYEFEVIDPATRRRVADGERGELVLTGLRNEAMPLIRYRTGDIVRVDEAACACGLCLRTMSHFGRLHEQVQCKGQRIVKMDLEAEILSVGGTGAYYLLAVENNRLEVLVEVCTANRESVLRAVREKVQDSYGITAKVGQLDKRRILEKINNSLKPGSLSVDDIASYRYTGAA